MRGGKARGRSRHKRHPGYGTNRVFESSGPEGKLRGNTNQLIEKYRALARDAQLSGDRIVAENFAQHAEHYVRLAGHLREVESKRQAKANNRHVGPGSPKHNGRHRGPSTQPKTPPAKKATAHS
ncbi:MAG: DUF4167 domain-containing protein [Rhodobacteraceae bacterium]|nr:DUF4167 domain-containing protein [Paracoccaceae bacterium]